MRRSEPGTARCQEPRALRALPENPGAETSSVNANRGSVEQTTGDGCSTCSRAMRSGIVSTGFCDSYPSPASRATDPYRETPNRPRTRAARVFLYPGMKPVAIMVDSLWMDGFGPWSVRFAGIRGGRFLTRSFSNHGDRPARTRAKPTRIGLDVRLSTGRQARTRQTGSASYEPIG